MPGAITNRLRSLASRVMTSRTRPSASATRGPIPTVRSRNGITAIEARRGMTRVIDGSGGALAGEEGAPPRSRRLPVGPWPLATRREGASNPVLGFEHPGRRGQVLLALADPAAPRRARSSRIACARWSSGANSSQLLQIVQQLVGLGRQASDQVLQDGGVAGAEATPLRDQPAVEVRAAVDLQPIQEVTDEQPGQRSQPLRIERLDPRLGRAGDLDDIDEAAGKIERDRVAAGLTTLRRAGSSTTLLILLRHQRSSPRGSFGTSHRRSQRRRALDGPRSKRQIGEERAHLARGRKRPCDPGQRTIVSGPSIST